MSRRKYLSFGGKGPIFGGSWPPKMTVTVVVKVLCQPRVYDWVLGEDTRQTGSLPSV